MIGIYLITNNVNGKRYVGQSVNTTHRIWEHKRKLKTRIHANEHLQRAWNKYGEGAFSFEVIETCDKEELDEKERYYIKEFGTQDRTKGYNIESGGCCHKELSAETKKKISGALKGRKLPPEVVEKLRGHSAWNKGIKTGLVPWNKGVPMSDELKRINAEKHRGKVASAETRRKMSEARMGHATSEETRNKIGQANSKPIACVEFEEMGAIFSSATNASKRTGIGRRSINNCLRGLSQTAGGLHWRYLEEGEI